MYFPPKKYRCPKCKFEFDWSVDHNYLGYLTPYCQRCFFNFLSKHVPIAKEVKEKENND